MKKFIEPEFEINELTVEDVITTSNDDFGEGGENEGGWG